MNFSGLEVHFGYYSMIIDYNEMMTGKTDFNLVYIVISDDLAVHKCAYMERRLMGTTQQSFSSKLRTFIEVPLQD